MPATVLIACAQFNLACTGRRLQQPTLDMGFANTTRLFAQCATCIQPSTAKVAYVGHCAGDVALKRYTKVTEPLTAQTTCACCHIRSSYLVVIPRCSLTCDRGHLSPALQVPVL